MPPTVPRFLCDDRLCSDCEDYRTLRALNARGYAETRETMDAFASGLAREWPDHGRSIEHALSKLAWVALAVGRRDDGMPCDECATEFIDRVWFRFDERQSVWTEQAEGPLRSPAGMLNVMATEVADRSRRGELPGDLVHWWATNGPDGYDWWTHDEKWAAIPHVHQLPAGYQIARAEEAEA